MRRRVLESHISNYPDIVPEAESVYPHIEFSDFRWLLLDQLGDTKFDTVLWEDSQVNLSDPSKISFKAYSSFSEFRNKDPFWSGSGYSDRNPLEDGYLYHPLGCELNNTDPFQVIFVYEYQLVNPEATSFSWVPDGYFLPIICRGPLYSGHLADFMDHFYLYQNRTNGFDCNWYLGSPTVNGVDLCAAYLSSNKSRIQIRDGDYALYGFNGKDYTGTDVQWAIGTRFNLGY